MAFSKILIRAANWVGDAVMSLPAIRAIRERFPEAHITLLARPWVAGLYAREKSIDRVIRYDAASGARDLWTKWRFARSLRIEKFDCAILLQNAFEAAMIAWLAGIPRRIGYARDGRGLLLTDRVPVPKTGEIPRHQRFYYLELLRRAGIIDQIPETSAICLEGRDAAAREGVTLFKHMSLTLPVVGVSPGAAFGSAKRWLPERFAQAAAEVARARSGSVALFGSTGERPLCADVAAAIEHQGIAARNLAGETTLSEFIELAAACCVFLTNDSGAMHIASALGIPTVAVFGSTDETATGPTGSHARVVRQTVECSPCLLRECPIDHRCMTRISAEHVTQVALELTH